MDQQIIHKMFDQYSSTLSWSWLDEPGWPLIDCSKSCLTLFGLSIEDVGAGTVLLTDLIHSDDIHDVIAGSQRIEQSCYDLSYRIKTQADGWQYIKDERCFFVPDGSHDSSYISVVHRIEVDQQAVNELKQTRELLKLILDSTQLGVWEYWPIENRAVLDKTWADMLGLDFETLDQTQEAWTARVHPDDFDRIINSVQRHFAGETEYYEELVRLKHGDGRWIHVLDRAKVAKRDSDGNVVRFIGTHTDITELVEAQQQALEALASRDRFFSAISHELRTPLHAVLGMAELLIPEMENIEQKDKIKVIYDSSSYLLALIRDILDIAKIEDGKMPLNVGWVDINGIVEKACSLFRDRAVQKGLEIRRISHSVNSTWLETDSVRIMQVLANLISNAVKYSEHGHIEISIIEEDDDLVLSIADTGIGIQDTKAVFRPYIQENHRREDDENSTGLGLTIVQNLCRLLQVDINLTSVLDQGSKFELRFPSSMRREEKTIVPRAAKTPKPELWGDIKILMVDDNPINRIVAKAMLNVSHVDYYEAGDGVEALEVLAKTEIDLVFMDLHMPNKGGLRTTLEMRETPALSEVPIIGVSADAYEEVKQKCLEAGMNDYVVKPFNRDQLLLKIEQWVASCTQPDDDHLI